MLGYDTVYGLHGLLFIGYNESKHKLIVFLCFKVYSASPIFGVEFEAEERVCCFVIKYPTTCSSLILYWKTLFFEGCSFG